MSCDDCTQAEKAQWWGGYRNGCKSCAARAVARSLAAFNAWHGQGTGEVQTLREMVSRVLPNVPKEEAKRLVRGWWDRDHEQQEAIAP